MSYGVFTSIIIEEEKTVFETDKPYMVGSNTLFVYLNGLLQASGIDYEEVDSRSIEFSEHLYVGDRLLMTSSFINSDLKLDSALIGNGKDALFKRYGSEQRLMFNQEYTLRLRLLDTDHKYVFTSRYSPMYSTVKVIRTDIQDIIGGMDDDTINFTLWQNSLLVNEISEVEFDQEAPPFFAKQWVRYKTEIDLITAVYLAISGNAGSVSKKLGAMSIERTLKIPFLKDMLSQLKEKLKPFEDQMQGERVTGRGFQKAGRSYPYPIGERRTF